MSPDALPLVAPFLGERYPDVGRLSDLIAPPYDVISDAERQALAARSAQNIVHLILPAGNGNRYERAAATLGRWRAEGILVRDQEPGIDVLQQEFTDAGGVRRVRTGMIAAVAVEPFEGGRVRPHERTHQGPKEDRLALLRATRTMCEALFMLARDLSGELARALADVVASPPAATAALGDVAIRVWRVTGSPAARLPRAAGAASLYIADGHHRYETTLAFHREHAAADRTLALIVPLRDPGLVVLPTHRIVQGPPVSEDEVRERLSGKFTIEVLEPARDLEKALTELRGAGCVVVLPEGRRLAARPRALVVFEAEDVPALRRVDVSWADRLVLPALRGGGTGRLAYASRSRDVIDEVAAGRAAAGMLLNPPAVEDVLAVADAGAVMPQKSTYFFPKVPSGLVLLDYSPGQEPR
jgi:uncharacterized protein (DUF1015 family)